MAKDNKMKVRRMEKATVRLNTLVNNLLDNIAVANSSIDPERSRELKSLLQQANDVITDEIDFMKTKTGVDISKFYYDLFNKQDKDYDSVLSGMEALFGSNKDAMYQSVIQANRNRNIYYDRLALLTESLHELDEAVSITRDSIITSDDVSNTISRSLSFRNLEANSEQQDHYIELMEGMESDFKLPHKIKSFIVPKTLSLGDMRVLTIPYNHIFSNASIRKAYSYASGRKMGSTPKASNNRPIQMESAVYEHYDFNVGQDDELMGIVESYATSNGFKASEYTANYKDSNFNLIMDDDLSPILIESLDGIPEGSLSGPDFDRMIKTTVKSLTKQDSRVSSVKNNQPLFTDGVKAAGVEKFDEITGCYFKIVDPRRLLPIKGLDESTMGYLYIHTPLGPDCSGNGSGFGTMQNSIARSNMLLNTNDRARFIAGLSERIYRNFSKKFLVDHIKFKETIANALLYNDYYTTGLTFQFIPVEYVTEIKIDEDLDGNGTSMLSKSMFKAQLYLGFFIFKYMSAIDRSNDTRIHYIKSSQIDKKTANRVQRTMREVQRRTPAFSNFSSYSGMMGTVNVANRDIFMPVGESDMRGIDFDVLQGQDVQMQNDFLDSMKQDFINATGVPSVMLNYINEADYAKTLVMAHARHLARVVSYQLDLNDGITELYKKLALYSGVPLGASEEETRKILATFEFKFNAPKMYGFSNTGELISNAQQLLEFVLRVFSGENGDDEDAGLMKDEFYFELAEILLPMLPWQRFKDGWDRTKLNVKKRRMEKAAEENSSGE